MAIVKPINSEKYIRLLETENKICFEVTKDTTKNDVKSELENTFNVKVEDVRVYITPKGKKRAIVKLSAENPAFDLATKLGLV
ncbi:MAG: large subunit ribosomal protein [Candidatus Woesearchaeota archaeon]|nr:large subunit ribosomal protein [Candidatus Woesearchaeota archaeon]MDN5327977.1 large subunit ribosomal protein [Candidatus Woesearchaeota archaeon]